MTRLDEKIPVIVTYGKKKQPSVFLCDSDQDAEKLLRKLFNSACKVEFEENHRKYDVDIVCDINDDNDEAYIYILNERSQIVEETKWEIGKTIDWKRLMGTSF